MSSREAVACARQVAGMLEDAQSGKLRRVDARTEWPRLEFAPAAQTQRRAGRAHPPGSSPAGQAAPCARQPVGGLEPAAPPILSLEDAVSAVCQADPETAELEPWALLLVAGGRGVRRLPGRPGDGGAGALGAPADADQPAHPAPRGRPGRVESRLRGTPQGERNGASRRASLRAAHSRPSRTGGLIFSGYRGNTAQPRTGRPRRRLRPEANGRQPKAAVSPRLTLAVHKLRLRVEQFGDLARENRFLAGRQPRRRV